MGEHARWAEPPSGLSFNGLLPNEAASVIPVLDSERWSKAEERIAELIACIQPNPSSEERRSAVADYVQRLIVKCFPCQVFTFGSVPLKTYLPDGDIDLTAFSDNQNLKDTWAHQVRDMLENEEKNEHAEFRVKEVQYIQAEVKIIKCLVENIVVDISFNQLGGLCTLCFLEEVDHMINDKHLFKRSIILIKAWCYYESRILGAHHGLISTYALETLVLYIFHVFNNSFGGPLEVLYRFLEFFSKFDWDNFCLSLWGPVPISSLPVVTAEPPRNDGGVLLLSKRFLDSCSYTYAGFPGGLENQGQPFVSKHFNVIDPLRVNNNLGRSVSKGNFFRIRSAFAFGAKRLARLLDCPKEDLSNEVNQFFMNTWDRHGSGHRPDVLRNDLSRLRLSNPDHQYVSENLRNNSNSSGKRNEITSSRETQVDRLQESSGPPSQHGNYPSESTSRTSHVPTVSRAQTKKSHGNLNNNWTSDQSRRDSSSNQNVQNDKGQRSFKPDYLASDIKGRCVFARTRSSPELTDSYGEVSSQGRLNKASESGKSQIASLRKNLVSGNLASHDIRSPTDDPSSVSHNLSHQSLDADANSVLNCYSDDLVLGAASEEFSSAVGTRGMQQEEQDLVNMMASSATHSFTGPLPFPLNISPGHLPLPLPPSVLATMGYSQRNLGGGIVTSVPLIGTPSGANMQFPQSLVSSPLTHYFPGIGLSSNSEDLLEPGNENFGHGKVNPVEADHDYWHEQDQGSSAGFDLDNGSFEMLQTDDKQQSTSAGYNFDFSRMGGSVSSRKAQHKLTKEARGSTTEDHVDPVHYQENRVNEVHFDDRSASSRSMPASHTSSVRSKSNSESSCEVSSAKVSKSAREKRGRKTASIAGYGKGKSVSDHSSVQADDENRDWNPPATTGTELANRSTGPQPVSSLLVSRHQIPGSEEAQTCGSDSMIPISSVHLGPGSGQRSMDNSGVLVYPTFPQLFITMVPVYNFQSEPGTSDASTSQFSGDEGLDNSDSGQNFDLSEGPDQSEVSSTSNSMRRSDSVEPLEHKSDILNSDFHSHWQNLQYGRLCQNPRLSPPFIYPSPLVVPPTYLQGRFPWDGPGRPLSANMNLFTQFMSYGPRLVPVTPLQSASNRPAGVHQHYMHEMPRYRSGTGTFLPNSKVSSGERHSTSTRRGNYSHDRSDHHKEREGSWNVNSKSRASGRSHSRNQAEKSNSRPDRLTATESRADRAWGSHRHETFPSFPTQNGPFRSNSTQSGSTNVAYGMYPLSTMNPNGVLLNGPTISPVVMCYPYDHNAAYGSPAEQLEFGSLGPVGFSGVNEVSQLSEGSQSTGTIEEQRYHGTSGQRSPPDQPSPQVQTLVAQRNYQWKDEDFPPLAFPNQGENDGGENYNEKSYHYQDFLVSPHS